MTHVLPGFSHARIVRQMRAAVAACDLRLIDRVVVTEAATGAYATTPVLAALAGARAVIAVTRDTEHGTVEDVRAATESLASLAGVPGRVSIVDRLSHDHLAAADVVTNSGHVRPIDAGVIESMKPGAVVPLMYEAWEHAARPADVDVDELRRRGIRIAGTNERHPAIDVFSYLGPLLVSELVSAGISAYRARVLLLCDNDFGPYLRDGLEAGGATVLTATCVGDGPAHPDEPDDLDAIVVALTPGEHDVLGRAEIAEIARRWPHAPLVQFWGDVDRAALRAHRIAVWPPEPPRRGHMAVLLSDLGPEPIVRLQCGGLKVAQVLLQPIHERTPADRAYLDELAPEV